VFLVFEIGEKGIS